MSFSKVVFATILLLCVSVSALFAQDNADTPVITPENAAQVEQIARLGNGVFTGSAAYNTTGDTLAVGGSIGLWLYDAHDLTAPPRLLDLDAWVSNVAFTSDDRYLAFIASNTTYIVDARSLETVMTIPGSNRLTWIPESHEMFVTTGDSYLDVQWWDMDTQSVKETLPRATGYGDARDNIHQLAVSPDGHYLGVAHRADDLYSCTNAFYWLELWDLGNIDASPLSLIYGGAFAFHPTEPVIVSALQNSVVYDSTGQLVVWNYEDDAQTYLPIPPTSQFRGAVQEIRFQPQGKTFAVQMRQEFETWDYEALSQLGFMGIPRIEEALYGMVAPVDAEYWLSVSSNSLLSLNSAAEVVSETPLDHVMQDVRFAPDGTMISQPADNVLNIWEEESTSNEPTASLHGASFLQSNGVVVWRAENSLNVLHYERDWDSFVIPTTSPTQHIEISEDGRQIAFQTQTNIEWWEITSTITVQVASSSDDDSLLPDASTISSFAFLADNHTLAITSLDNNTTPELYLIGDHIHRMLRGYPPGTQIQLGPQGDRIYLSRRVVGQGYLTDVFRFDDDAPSGIRYLETFEGGAVEIVTPSLLIDVRRRSFFGTFVSLQFRNRETFEVEREIAYGGSDTASAERHLFSPDYSRLLTFEQDSYNCGILSRNLSLWDVESATELYGTRIDVRYDAAFNPDSSLVALTQAQTLSLLIANDGTALVFLDGHTDNILAVTFSPDGSRILTASADGTVRVWGIPESE